jgi:ubiquinone/menaquinone biosynthesis C-methylase UbiE
VKRLAGTSELLDGPLTDSRTVAGNLRDLRRVNRLSGGSALSLRALEALLRRSVGVPDVDAQGSSAITLLDIGTGAADIPVAMLEAWRARGESLEVLAVDRRPEILEAAVAREPGLAAVAGLTLRVADGRALPFPDDAFDVAHASLVLHHLEPDEALTMLGEMARVARRGVVLNDLARGRVRWLLAWLVLHLSTRNAMTRHDGPMSVRRAYTSREASDLVERAGLRVVHLEHGLLRHRWALAAVPA